MRETRNFLRRWPSSRSSPITYQEPDSFRSASGFSDRSRCSSREIDQYSKRTVRHFEIAVSSFPSLPAISGE